MNSQLAPRERSDAELDATLRQQIETADFRAAAGLLEGLSAETRTRILSRLAPEVQETLVANLGSELAADVLLELPESQAVSLLDEMGPKQAAQILEELPRDEQADLVGELSAPSMDAILAEMDDEHASAVRELTEYDDDEAGGLMIVEYVALRDRDTVRDAVTYLQRHADEFRDYHIQYVYVVDDVGRLRGVLTLRDLLLLPATARLDSVMIADPLSVTTRTLLTELHALFLHMKFIGVPVVDDDGVLVGVLRRGVVEEAMADRYADEYRKAQGLVTEELRTMPTLLRARRRLAWLSINIALNVVAASVIAAYQDTLARVIALAVFLPIISDMSGCSGNQAVAVSMRELSLGLVQAREVLRVWLKEVSVGLINGVALGALIAAVAWAWQGNPWLGAVVGIAMALNTMLAVSIGGTLPLVMRLLRMDPALASGPILTTVTDMCGFFLVLGGATLVIDKLA